MLIYKSVAVHKLKLTCNHEIIYQTPLSDIILVMDGRGRSLDNKAQ